MYFGRLNGILFVQELIDLSGQFVTIKRPASAGQVDLRTPEVGMAEFEELDGVELVFGHVLPLMA